MTRTFKVAVTIFLIAISVATGFLLARIAEGQKAAIQQYSLPLVIGDKTYTIDIVTNETSKPLIYLPENEKTLKYFSVDFISQPGNKQFFFNITYPTNLIWGNFTLVAKYYIQDPSRYTLSSNGTHQSVYMSYIHYNTNCHFEIRGTEAAW